MPFNLANQATWVKESLLWSTQFHDLRLPSSLGNETRERRRQFLREVKHHALFFEHTIIRDSDVINHLELQGLIEKNDPFITMLASQAFVFGLRSEVSTFSELNKQTGRRRAFKERFEAVRKPLERIDELFASNEWPIFLSPYSKEQDEFRRLLERFGQFDMLSHGEKELLAKAIQHAIDQSDDGMLRFGSIYRFLLKQQGVSPSHELIRCCRAAHSLALPSLLGIAPSTARNDIEPAVLIHLLAKDSRPLGDVSHWIERFPRKILTESALDLIRFDEIAQLRGNGHRLGYFKAVANVQRSVGMGDLFEKAFVDYLEKLAEYIGAIGVECKIELADWQTSSIKKRIKQRNVARMTGIIAVPVVIGTVMSTVTPGPAGLVAGAISGALSLAYQLKDLRKPDLLVQITDGAVITKGSVKPKSMDISPQELVKRRVDNQLSNQNRRMRRNTDSED